MKAARESVLVVDRVEKRFGSIEAVTGVSLRVEAGEIYALIGPNGAGKTTLVKTMVGLLTPDQGSIYVSGVEMAKNPTGVKRLLGYIPDEPWVYPYLTAREFLEYAGELHGISREAVYAHIDRWAGEYALTGLLDFRLADFSRGNKQKVAIIAALIHKPQLLVVDEPIVGLDAYTQKKTEEMMVDFVGDGGAVFVCTHTLPVVEHIATRIGVIRQGSVIAQGTLKELRTKTKVRGSLEEVFVRLVGKNEEEIYGKHPSIQ